MVPASGYAAVTTIYDMDSGWFVGRSGELTSLRELVARVRDGVGAVLLVMGEQGIGKSAFLREGLTGAAGCRIGWGAGDELGQRFPLRLMVECLGEEGRLAASIGMALPGSVPVLEGDPVRAAGERLMALVDRLCAVSPVVVVAEDLQWADEASLLVWQRLSRAVGQLPLLLAGSCRPAWAWDEVGRLAAGVSACGGVVMTLEPLPSAEVAELAGGLLGAPPGKELARLVGRAGGNPLYVRELVDALVRGGRVHLEAGVAELTAEPGAVALSASLAAAISDRLSGLPDGTVGVLRWAAILGGEEFSLADLSQVTGRPVRELAGVVEQAVTGGVVAEAGLRLRFRHGLIRQALYEGIPEAMRAALHLQAAQELAAAGMSAELVAAQLVAVPEATREWVLAWLTGAAPELTHRAPQVAAELLRRVLGQLPELDARREGLEAALVTVAFLLGRNDEAEWAARRLMARTQDPDRAAEAAWLLAYSLARSERRTEDAAAVVADAIERPGISEAWLARLRALQAPIMLAIGQLELADATARVALEAGERAEDRIAVGYARHALWLVALAKSDHTAMLHHIDQALAVIGDDPRATDLRLMLIANRSDVLGLLDRWAEARAAIKEALVLAEQTATPRQALVYCAAAELYYSAGQWDDALAFLEPAAELPVADTASNMIIGLLALIAGHRDDKDTAENWLTTLQRKKIGDARLPDSLIYPMLARALIAERSGRPGDAAAELAACLKRGRMTRRYMLLPTLVRLGLTVGDGDIAGAATDAAAADAAAADARGRLLPVMVAAVDHCRGLADGDPRSVLAAGDYYDRTDRPFHRAHALEDAAVMLAVQGDLAKARRASRTASAIYRMLGATWDLRRAGVRLQEFGIRLGRSPARLRSGWEPLTPTEARIAGLVADGLSNPDIATELSLSRHTVQTHVSHILAKLGARSRNEVIQQSLNRRQARPGSSGWTPPVPETPPKVARWSTRREPEVG